MSSSLFHLLLFRVSLCFFFFFITSLKLCMQCLLFFSIRFRSLRWTIFFYLFSAKITHTVRFVIFISFIIRRLYCFAETRLCGTRVNCLVFIILLLLFSIMFIIIIWISRFRGYTLFASKGNEKIHMAGSIKVSSPSRV